MILLLLLGILSLCLEGRDVIRIGLMGLFLCVVLAVDLEGGAVIVVLILSSRVRVLLFAVEVVLVFGLFIAIHYIFQWKRLFLLFLQAIFICLLIILLIVTLKLILVDLQPIFLFSSVLDLYLPPQVGHLALQQIITKHLATNINTTPIVLSLLNIINEIDINLIQLHLISDQIHLVDYLRVFLILSLRLL